MRGYRTFLVNLGCAALVCAAELMAWLSVFDWRGYVEQDTALTLVLLVNTANIILRHVTDEPAGWRRANNERFSNNGRFL